MDEQNVDPVVQRAGLNHPVGIGRVEFSPAEGGNSFRGNLSGFNAEPEKVQGTRSGKLEIGYRVVHHDRRIVRMA